MSQVESSEISSDDVEESWVNGFCSASGNIMFCKIDKAFIEDNFNLYGLKLYCPVQYNKALSTILDRAGKFPMVFK
jgi:casein kinase II subunit beta